MQMAKKWAEGMRGDEDLGLNMKVGPTPHAPGT